MPKRKLRILTIGGGSGAPTINRALLDAGASNISSVAAMFDSGGATGIRRLYDSQGREVAYSDAIRILLSLMNPDLQEDKKEAIKTLLTHKNEKNQVLGQEIANRFFDNETGFAPLVELLENFGAEFRGTVLPSSTEPAHIIFSTTSNRMYSGEHHLDNLSMSRDTVVNMALSPSVKAHAPAVDAIRQADIIFLSPGSVHGSLLCNFLPEGMAGAMKSTKAEIYLFTNLVSTRNETHELALHEYVALVEKYSSVRPTGVIVPEESRASFESSHPDVAGFYDLEHSHFLGWEQKELYRVQSEGIEVITHRATSIVEVSGTNAKIVRHDPQKLAPVLAGLLSSND